MRSAPMWVGSTTLSAPAWISLLSVLGSSPRAMICSLGFRLRALRVMNTLAASFGQDGGQDLGPLDAGGLERALVGGVAVQAQIAELAGLGPALVVALQDQEGGAAPRQVAGQHHPDAAEAADDDVVLQLVDFARHPVAA